MQEVTRFALPNGGSLLVEAPNRAVESSSTTDEDMGLFRHGVRVLDSDKSLTEVFKDFIPATQIILDSLKAVQPDRVEVEMGVTLSASMGIALAKTSAAGNLKVKIAWERNSDTKGNVVETEGGDQVDTLGD